MRKRLLASGFLLLSVSAPAPVWAQTLSQKGVVEARTTLYPQEAANDDTQAVVEGLFRYEASARAASWLRITGAVDLRADSNDQTATGEAWDWYDRGAQRAALAVRRLNATLSHGPLTVEVGKQFVRWGKTDVLNPTDRFAPRDFMNVFDSDLLAVSGARVLVGTQADTLDVVWVPSLTPSRTPLPDQRWAPELAVPPGVRFVDGGRTFPSGDQIGARWNHVAPGFEFSLSGYSGYNHLPSADVRFNPGHPRPTATVSAFYPELWMGGADAAVPFSWFTVKGEAAFFGSDDPRVDEYWLYVVQFERQSGEWFLVAGYAGEVVVTDRPGASFAPDRGLTQTFLGRAGYTIDTNRSLAFEGAIRQDLDGHWLRAEYSHASGQHLRFILQASWIGGDPDTFFGRYDRNSNIAVTIRYSF